MRKYWIIGVAAMLLLSACGKEEVAVVRQMNVLHAPGLTEEVPVPAWFYPETGEIEWLCGEEIHGADCPFAGMASWPWAMLTEQLVFFAETDTGAALYGYHTDTGEKTLLLETDNPLWRSSHLLKSPYLYQWDSLDENGVHTGERYHVRQIHLLTGESAAVPDDTYPWQIENDTGFYLMSDPAGYTNGVYSQPVNSENGISGPKELLLYEAEIDAVYLEPDALYWKGYDGMAADGEAPDHLYRYDRVSRSTVLLKENFTGQTITGYGTYLYAVCRNEDAVTLQRIHKESGDCSVVYTLEEGWHFDGGSQPEAVGQYIVATLVTDNETAKLVYDTAAEQYRVYGIE